MTWVRIDDGFADHPKIIAAGPMALVAQVRALCYCSRHLTDGRISEEAVKTILSGLSVTADEMLQAKLWQKSNSGYRVHDYLAYNPNRHDTLELRRKKAQAGRAGGQASALARAQASAWRHASEDLNSPTRPLETEASKKTRRVAHATGSNGNIDITADEERGLPLIAKARGITLAQAKSELLTAKLREAQGLDG